MILFFTLGGATSSSYRENEDEYDEGDDDSYEYPTSDESSEEDDKWITLSS